jgi:hypothetical protein
MSVRGSIGSLIESHCVKGPSPDRRNFCPDPANAPARAEFKLGIFPPDHHVPPATPTPTPAKPKP